MGGLKDGGRNVYQPNPRCDSARSVLPGNLEQQWNMDRFIVEEDAVMILPVFTEGFSMVRHDSDYG
jgi:hypothetical protein